MGTMAEIFLSFLSFFFLFFFLESLSVCVFKYDLRVLHFGPQNLVALELNIAARKQKPQRRQVGRGSKGPVRICLADSPASVPLALFLCTLPLPAPKL